MNLCVGGVLQVDVNVGGSEVVVTYLDFVAMAFIRAEIKIGRFLRCRNDKCRIMIIIMMI